MHNTSAFATLGKILEKPAIETDWQGKVIFINKPAKHLLGLYQQGKELNHIVECLPKAAGLFEKIAQRPTQPEDGLITIVERAKVPGNTVNGDVLSLEIAVMGIGTNSGGRLLFVLRVLHSESFHSKHRLIARMLNQAKIPLSVIDEDGFFVEVNDSLVELFGYQSKELIGKEFTMLIEPDMQRRAMRKHHDFFEDESEQQTEWRYKTASGEIKTVLVTANVLKNPDGRRMQMRTYQDITAHVKNEIHFKKSEAFMHHIFDFADVGIALVDTDGLTTHANLAFCTLFSYRPLEIIDEPFNIIFNPAQRDYAYSCYEQALENGAPEENEWHITLPEGSERLVHTLFHRLTFPDEQTRMLIIARDVSVEKNVRKNLLQDKEQAELALIEKAQFLTVLGRKLRTLATPIIGFTDLLDSTHLSEEQSEYLNSIRKNSLPLVQFSEDILEYARVETEKLSTRAIHIGLADFLEELRGALQETVPKGTPTIAARIASECPANILGNPPRLRSLIFKLGQYAIGQSQGEKISIDLEGYPIGEDGKQAQMTAIISYHGQCSQARSDGPSLAPFQVPESESNQVNGFELSLAICKSLADSLNATIHCKNVTEETTQILLEFEAGLPDAPAEDAQSTSDSPESGRPLRVVCADDSPSNRLVLKALITRLGHQITLVSSGEDLLSAVKDEDFDLICMDLSMPRISGYETCERIRAGECGEGNRDIYIVATTAHNSAEIHQQCQEAGMNDYLTKPISRKSLAQALSRAKEHLESAAAQVTS